MCVWGGWGLGVEVSFFFFLGGRGLKENLLFFFNYYYYLRGVGRGRGLKPKQYARLATEVKYKNAALHNVEHKLYNSNFQFSNK